jgi:hypothetical protein
MAMCVDSWSDPRGNICFFANVRGHRWLPVARSMPGEERAQARGVTRVVIRWIALLGYFLFAPYRGFRE